MPFVMMNYLKAINDFLGEKSEVKNVELITLAVVGVLLGLALAELSDAIRTRRERKAKEVSR